MVTTGRARLTALDALRGLAVAGMVLVVSPGDWSQAYPQLQHAAWNGWTLADLVFPTFLFSVGAALGLSFPREWTAPGARRRFWGRLARRVVALVVLGLAVEASYNAAIALGAPYPGVGDWAHVRLPGILQRIGLCYGLGAIVAVATGRRLPDGRLTLRPAALAGAAVALLVGYHLLLALVPVPGVGPGRLDPAGNLGASLDRALFGAAHLWPLGWAAPGGPVVYDPEGLLSSLPATANLLFGAVAGALSIGGARRERLILLAGVALVAAGLLLDPVVAINKRIWTGSFALLTSGVAAIAFALLLAAMRHAVAARLLRPIEVLGGNAILAFLLSTLFSRVSGFPLIPAAGVPLSPQLWGYRLAGRLAPDPHLASLGCALAIVAIVTALIWPLHRRALHFRL